MKDVAHNRTKCMITFTLSLLVMIIVISPAFAWDPPPRTIDFRGFTYIENEAAQDSTVVSIWANNRTLMMDSTVLQYGNGYFRNLKIIWDNPSTAADEGVAYDETSLEEIEFKIGDYWASDPSNVTVKASQEGATIDLQVYAVEEEGEQGKNEQEIPTESEFSPGIVPPQKIIERCDEDWECSDWSPEECPESGKQSRACSDRNRCGTESSKPDEERSCSYIPGAAPKPPEEEKGREGEKQAIEPFKTISMIPLGAAGVTILLVIIILTVILIKRRRKRNKDVKDNISSLLKKIEEIDKKGKRKKR